MAESYSDVQRLFKLATEVNNPEESAQLYDTWAETFEQDLNIAFTYNAAKITTTYLAKFVTAVDAEIVDVCCGTGLIGQELSSKGYKIIDGIDGSQKMLEKARMRNIYRNLIKAFIGPKPLDIPTGSYDALGACGCFYPSHLDGDSFQELARLVRIGGHVVIAYNKGNQEVNSPELLKELDDKASLLVADGIWEKICDEVVPDYHSTDEGDVEGIVKVFKVRAHPS